MTGKKELFVEGPVRQYMIRKRPKTPEHDELFGRHRMAYGPASGGAIAEVEDSGPEE